MRYTTQMTPEQIKEIQNAFQHYTIQGASKNHAAELLACEFGATNVRNALIQANEGNNNGHGTEGDEAGN